MKVLKFGGSSVATAENINKVAAIIKNSYSDIKTVIVVSALGGITDALIQSATLACAGDETYKEKLLEIEKKHIDVVKQLLPVTNQSSLLSLVKKICNEIEDICNGIFLLGELSVRTKDRIVSYGELLSLQIISAKFKRMELENEWKDARELMLIESNF